MSMSAAQARRQAVAQALEEAVEPVSAAALAERFSVSRQIIVGDVALLRAGGTDILATPRGISWADGEAAWSAPWPVFTLRRRWSGSSTPSWTPGARWWT